MTEPWSWLPAAIERWERIVVLELGAAFCFLVFGLALVRVHPLVGVVTIGGAIPQVLLAVASCRFRRALIRTRHRELGW